MRVSWPGVITSFSIAPANVYEFWMVPEVVEGTSGILVGDRNYHSPRTAQELREGVLELVARYASRSKDPNPSRSAFLSKLRYRIDTVLGQLTERYTIKRLCAKDLWHLTSKLGTALCNRLGSSNENLHIGLEAAPIGSLASTHRWGTGC